MTEPELEFKALPQALGGFTVPYDFLWMSDGCGSKELEMNEPMMNNSRGYCGQVKVSTVRLKVYRVRDAEMRIPIIKKCSKHPVGTLFIE